MAWHSIESSPSDVATDVQAFEDDAGTSSIDSVSIAYDGHNQVTVLIEYTAA